MSLVDALRYKLPTYKVALVKEGAEDMSSTKIIHTPDDAVDLFTPLKHYSEEVFVCLMLNTNHLPIGVHEISKGTISASLVHMREAFKAAILANAHSVMFAHNHPSGSQTVSSEDRETTKKLVAVGELLGITVLDHLVITDSGYTSIRENYPDLWSRDKCN